MEKRFIILGFDINKVDFNTTLTGRVIFGTPSMEDIPNMVASIYNLLDLTHLFCLELWASSGTMVSWSQKEARKD
jgi:hypothetical protein